MNARQPRLILASASPRRLQFLKNLGLDFTVIPSHIEEFSEKSEAADIVEDLALMKARDVASKLDKNNNSIVLAADTIVVRDQDLLGKPRSKEEAYEMLMSLSGRAHQVYTGVAIVRVKDNFCKSLSRVSSVYFRKLLDTEARCYANSEEPSDKAGAYALQGTAAAFVERVEGCYTNIIGLPVSDTVLLLREFGMTVLGCDGN
ncbi:MAG: Maf family protein [Candidatus Obscuribacterales bacterium]|nr:Maf family protein [Candidatus Obscuribacterales bacterium]